MTAFHVPGAPVPKARPRVVNGRAYTPKRTVEYEQFVRMCYQGPLYTGAVHVTLEVHLPNLRRVDLDNIIKSVLDGLESKAYANDGQVYWIEARKRIVSDDPGVWGSVEEIESRTGLA